MMPSRLLLAILFPTALLGFTACGVESSEVSGVPAASAGEFGTFDAHEAIAIADVLADPTAFEGRSGVLEGELVGVCSSSGCWVELGSPDQHLMVLLRDASDSIFSIPTHSTGRAQASGELRVVDGEPQLIARGIKLATP